MNTIKSFSLLAIASLFVLVSCNKEDLKLNTLEHEIANEDASFRIATSGYEMNQVQPLGGLQDEVYTQGILEYKKDGEVLATVNFGDESGLDKATIIKDGVEYEMDLKKEGGKDDKGKDKYKKVIVEPLVKADDCGYEIVSGIIKYYDIDSGDWLATIDFGDGTCDDEAEKETADGFSTFKVSEYYK